MKLLGGLVALMLAGAVHAQGEVLKVCADPDNPPYSRSTGDERGFYVDLAELVAKHLSMRTEYAWYATWYGRRAVRSTLLAKECDAYFGLPDDGEFMGRSVEYTKPFMTLSYALFGSGVGKLASFEQLKGKPVAVLFSTTPQILLAVSPGYQHVTFRNSEQALQALDKGEVGYALLWGPEAGHVNRAKFRSKFEMRPVGGTGLEWSVGIAVRKGSTALREKLNRALAERAKDVNQLAQRYGFPVASDSAGLRALHMENNPFDEQRRIFSEPKSAAPAASRVMVASIGPVPALLAQAVPARQEKINPVDSGRRQFNLHCSHCHSTNAMSFEPSMDLRRLKIRYGAKMRQIMQETINNGRPDKGMPPWKGSLTDEEIRHVYAFLESVQRE